MTARAFPHSNLRMLHRLAALIALGTHAVVSAQCLTFGPFVTRGALPQNLQPPRTATEISGMAASRHNPGVLWIHDDGAAGGAQALAIRTDGTLAQQYTLAGITNRDWEEVALGPGPTPGREYLYFADTGNNALGYISFNLIRVAEPDVPATPGSSIPLAAESFAFRYPSGTFNTETLWLDPVDGTPYVLTKENSSTCRLFRYPLPLDAGVEKALVLAATLTNMPVLCTGGTVSADGRWIFVRSNTTIRAWPRAVGTTFASALAGTPCSLAHSLGLAEAIAIDPDGRSLWAISEGSGALVENAPLTFPAGVPVQYAFGTGLAGVVGTPGLAATHAPRLGGPPLTFAGWQAAPSALALLLLSPIGYPDGVVAFAGGWLHAAPDTILIGATSVGGTVAFPLGSLPDAPFFYGLSVFAQLLVDDPAALRGIALSAGLRLTLDR